MTKIVKAFPISVIVLSIFILTQCSSENSKPTYNKNLPLSTPSIYGEFSLQEITDSLYSDTNYYRDYFDSTKVDSFMGGKIEELVQKIEKDGNDSTTLFPEAPFDQVFGKDAIVHWGPNGYTVVYGPSTELTSNQVKRLMDLINNPLHFSWGECGTWEPSVQFDFYHQGKFVRSLDVGCSWQIKTDYEKVKFGTFNHSVTPQFLKLCSEIGLKNE